MSSTGCIDPSLFLGIDEHALGERDLPFLAPQPPLRLVEKLLDLAVLAETHAAVIRARCQTSW
jgi:hypothetical protein